MSPPPVALAIAIAVALGLASLLSGCAKTQSSNIDSDAIYITAKFTGDSASKVTCSATLQVGGLTGTYIELTGGDEVKCDDGEDSFVMEKDETFFGSVTYRTTDVVYDPGRTYRILFSRADGTTFTFTAILPDPVTITSPVPGTTHGKETPLTVTWSLPGSVSQGVRIGTRVTESGSSSAYSTSVPDTGSHTLPGSSLKADGANVPAEIQVERWVSGEPDAVMDGTSRAYQERSVTITLTD